MAKINLEYFKIEAQKEMEKAKNPKDSDVFTVILKIKNDKISNKKNSFYGFTLVEILVVVAIIGLMGSIVLVAARGVTERAKVYRMLQFSASFHHAVGANLVGEWKFEENDTDPIVYDTSGNGKNGYFFNPSRVKSAINEIGKAAEINTTTGGVILINDSTDLDGISAMSVQFWYKPIPTEIQISDPPWTTVTFGMAIAKYDCYQVFFTNSQDLTKGYIVFRIFSSEVNTEITTIGAEVEPFNENKWHHFAGTYYGGDTNNKPRFKIFLDGALVYEKEINLVPGVPLPYIIANNDSSLSIGGIRGQVDEVKIYNDELPVGIVKQLYKEGAEKMGLVVKN